MVNLLTEKKFSFLLAKRNLISNLKNTLVIIITLSLVFAVFMMMLGVRGIYEDIFTKEAKTRYQDIDLIISYDEYSPTRFINKRQINENYEDITYALAFFNLQVLTESADELYYSNMLSSLPHELEILLDIDVDISSNQAIITKTFSENNNLEIGDYFSFYILENKFEYEVADVVNDKGVFSDNSFFIDKSVLFTRLYSTSLLDNFGNVIYINSSNYESIYQDLHSDVLYQDYLIRYAVDEEYIDGIVSEYTSMIVVAGIIVLLALLIVLDSLFLIVLKDIFNEMGVIDTLGGKKSMGRFVCFYQWGIYLFISLIFGTILAHLVINIGASFYGVKAFLIINPLIILATTFILGLLVYLKNTRLLLAHERVKTIDKIRDKRYIVGRINTVLFLIFTIFLIIVITLKPFPLKYNSLVIVVLSIYVSLSVLVMVLRTILRVFKNDKTTFGLFNARYMNINKNIHQSLKVVFLSLIVVAIMVSVRLFIAGEIKQVQIDNKFDLLVVNIYDYDDDLLDDLLEYDINQADPALVFNNVFVKINQNNRQLVRNFVSMDNNAFYNYFDYQLGEVKAEYQDDELPYILFPKTYQTVYGFEEGDIIQFDISPDLKEIDFVIGGFIDTNFDHIVYSNIYDKLDNYDLSINSVFVNSDNIETVNDDLIKDYSAKMYYIINGEESLNKSLDLAKNVLALFTVITVFIILSFVFVVINNTVLKFYTLKNEIAKIKVIGQSNYSFGYDMIKEFLLLTLTIVIVGLTEILILSENLRYVLLFFDYYKDLSASVQSVSIGYLVVIFSFAVSYIYYYLLIKKIIISREIRIY